MRIPTLTIRPATPEDIPAIRALAELSTRILLKAFLSEAQMAAMDDIIEIDAHLVDDRTYSVAQVDGQIVAIGGWSRRKALTHAAHDASVPDEVLDPLTEPGRVRHMYTHPDFVRRGLGRLILNVAETGARLAGFKSAELLASPLAETLYASSGWHVIERPSIKTRSGIAIELAHMTKNL